MSLTLRRHSGLKSLVHSAFGLVGLEVRRRRSMREPPLLYDDLSEALYMKTAHSAQVAFRAPVAQIVDWQGFAFRKDAWHPFVATVDIFQTEGPTSAHDFLANYYTTFQPSCAAEALLDFPEAPDVFRELPAHMFRLAPWSIETPEETDAIVSAWVQRDNLIHSGEALSLKAGGYPLFGPVSPAKFEIEVKRLFQIIRILSTDGYNRRFGDCYFRFLRRGNEVRLVAGGGGYHRAAVMAGLGYEWVPGQFMQTPIDTRDVDYWPQVRRGVWTRKQALAYVDHLFDHSSAVWAQQHVNALGLKGFASLHGAKHEILPPSRASSHRRDPLVPAHNPRGVGG
jgi:hypothetical protein